MVLVLHQREINWQPRTSQNLRNSSQDDHLSLLKFFINFFKNYYFESRFYPIHTSQSKKFPSPFFDAVVR